MVNTSPANRLLELEEALEGGWIPIEKLSDVQELEGRDGRSGGHFSAGYVVRNEQGKTAFMKAMDYEAALRSTTPSEMIIRQAEAYRFEKESAERCTGLNMNYVVRYIGAGTVRLADNEPVEYIIFEQAEGDIREAIAPERAFSQIWAFRTLHHAASGLYELHRQRMAHQDVKPSNLLVTLEERNRARGEQQVWRHHEWALTQQVKLSDFGSLSIEGKECPSDEKRWAGDALYSPLELLYGNPTDSWQTRRIGCDLYMLGTLAFFLCTGGGQLNLEILTGLEVDHQPTVMGGYMGWNLRRSSTPHSAHLPRNRRNARGRIGPTIQVSNDKNDK